MRTLLASLLLALVTAMMLRALDARRPVEGLSLPDADVAELAASFTEFREAAIRHVEALGPEGRAQLACGEDGATVGRISVEDLDDFLEVGWTMPVNDAGEDAWQAWLMTYTDGTQTGGDGFGAMGNLHAALLVTSSLGSETGAALVLAVRGLADRPAGIGLACVDAGTAGRSCDHTDYLGLGLPVAVPEGGPQVDDASLLGSTLFERAPCESGEEGG